MTKKPSAPRKKRGREPLPESLRKDRLIQARVPDDLEVALREEAAKRRVTVSQLIRNVLENTFDLVDHVVAEGKNLAETVKRDARRIADSAQGKPRMPKPPKGASEWQLVEAWHEVIVQRDTVCARCGGPILSGQQSLLSVTTDPKTPKVWLCRSCGLLL